MEYLVTKFNIEANAELMQTARELLADAIASIGYESFEDTPEGMLGYIQRDFYHKTSLEEILENFILPQVQISYTTQEVESKDWNETWEAEGFEPIIVDNQLVIYDAKLPLPKDMPQTVSTWIAIDARLAFGTGTHETTRMIVSTLLHMDLKEKRVLDCGCGTGILGIVASKLGAQDAVAYDIDEWSVENTRHNAELNKVENLEVFHGNASILSHISGCFDIVLANINRNILLADMPAFKEAMNHGATLILSGFYKEDIPLLEEKAKEIGLSHFNAISDGDWACLIIS